MPDFLNPILAPRSQPLVAANEPSPNSRSSEGFDQAMRKARAASTPASRAREAQPPAKTPAATKAEASSASARASGRPSAAHAEPNARLKPGNKAARQDDQRGPGQDRGDAAGTAAVPAPAAAAADAALSSAGSDQAAADAASTWSAPSDPNDQATAAELPAAGTVDPSVQQAMAPIPCDAQAQAQPGAALQALDGTASVSGPAAPQVPAPAANSSQGPAGPRAFDVGNGVLRQVAPQASAQVQDALARAASSATAPGSKQPIAPAVREGAEPTLPLTPAASAWMARMGAGAGQEATPSFAGEAGAGLAKGADSAAGANAAAAQPGGFASVLGAITPHMQPPGAANIAAAHAEANIAASPGSAEFGAQVGQRIALFVREGIEHARLHLHPAELGPVSVQVQLNGQSAQINLSAENALTRQALQEAMPQLAGQLREAGLTLTGGGVFDQSRSTPQNGHPQSGAEGARESSRSAGGDAPAHGDQLGLAAGGGWIRRRGVVDLVA